MSEDPVLATRHPRILSGSLEESDFTPEADSSVAALTLSGSVELVRDRRAGDPRHPDITILVTISTKLQTSGRYFHEQATRAQPANDPTRDARDAKRSFSS